MNFDSYCINLSNRPERMQRMNNRFKSENLKVNRFEAINQDNPMVIDMFSNNNKNPLIYTKGAFACRFSHEKLWEISRKENKTLLIFEDDVFFHKQWRNILQNSLNILNRNSNWSMFFLDALGVEHNWDLTQERHGIKKAKLMYNTGAYIIKPQTASYALEMWKDKPALIDEITTWIQDVLPCYYNFPFLCVQERMESDVQESNDHIKRVENWYKFYFSKFSNYYKEQFTL